MIESALSGLSAVGNSVPVRSNYRLQDPLARIRNKIQKQIETKQKRGRVLKFLAAII